MPGLPPRMSLSLALWTPARCEFRGAPHPVTNDLGERKGGLCMPERPCNPSPTTEGLVTVKRGRIPRVHRACVRRVHPPMAPQGGGARRPAAPYA
jgi:hypothetical protein